MLLQNVLRIYVEADNVKHVVVDVRMTVGECIKYMRRKLGTIDTNNFGLFEVQGTTGTRTAPLLR
jgi:hypothetical protein